MTHPSDLLVISHDSPVGPPPTRTKDSSWARSCMPQRGGCIQVRGARQGWHRVGACRWGGLNPGGIGWVHAGGGDSIRVARCPTRFVAYPRLTPPPPTYLCASNPHHTHLCAPTPPHTHICVPLPSPHPPPPTPLVCCLAVPPPRNCGRPACVAVPRPLHPASHHDIMW